MICKNCHMEVIPNEHHHDTFDGVTTWFCMPPTDPCTHPAVTENVMRDDKAHDPESRGGGYPVQREYVVFRCRSCGATWRG